MVVSMIIFFNKKLYFDLLNPTVLYRQNVKSSSNTNKQEQKHIRLVCWRERASLTSLLYGLFNFFNYACAMT